MASQSDEEINAEFEREAEQAFQNVVKGARKREDDDEFQVDDEFDEAFNSVEYDARRAGNEENGAGLAKQQQSDAKNDGSEIWPNKNSSEMLENVDSGQGTDHEVFDEKENAGENIEMKRLIDLVFPRILSCCFNSEAKGWSSYDGNISNELLSSLACTA